MVTSSYANLLAITNVSSRRLIYIHQLFTKDTFHGSFQSICNDVFTRRPVSNGYTNIIALLRGNDRYTDEFVS